MFQPKKLLLLLLALVMVLTAFTACNNNDGNTDDSTESTSTDGTTGGNGDTDDGTGSTEVVTDALQGVKFEGQQLSVLAWKPSNITEYEETFDENASVVEQEVFNRCDLAQTKLNVKIALWSEVAESDFMNQAELSHTGGGTHDMFIARSNHANNLTTRGYLSNLLQKDYYLDWDHPAWPQAFVEDCTISGKLYFCTGDISTNLIFMTSVVFWNKDLVDDFSINDKIDEKYGYADLYDLAYEGKWTFDKMYELATDVYRNTNTASGKDSGDTYGLITYKTIIENIFYGGGYKTVKVDDGVFSLTDEFMNAELVGGVLQKAIDFFYETDFGFYATDATPHTTVMNIFGEGRALFSMAPASHAYNTHSLQEDLNYSVLPIPKHTESQDTYYSVQSFPYCMYTISSAAKNPAITSAFMQALAQYSNELTRVALFDKMMKGRYSDDPEDADMWNMAIDANVFDIGRIFATSIGPKESDQYTVMLLRDNFGNKNANWQGTLSSFGRTTAQYVNAITGKIALLPD